MIKRYKVTIYNNNNKYKPISTIIQRQQLTNLNELEIKQFKEDIIYKGLQEICNKMNWSTREVKKYNYTKVSISIIE